METTLSKNEKILIGVVLFAAVLFIGLFTQLNFKNKSVSQFDAVNFINYQMGRSSESYSEYSLNGRDVDQVYEGLKTKELAQIAKAVTPEELKKANEKKKAEDAKKAQAKAATTQKAKTPATAKINAVANNTTDKNISKSLDSDSNQYTNNNANNVAKEENDVNPTADTKAKPDANKKTFAQWRALIFSKPTQENVTAFIEAYRKNLVTKTEFQALAQELLGQSDEKYKGLAIMALRAQPSLESLSQLTHVSTQNLSVSMQSYLNQGILAYLQSQNVAILNQALQTSDKVLVTKALTILNTNLPKLNQGDYSTLTDGRNRRDSDTTSSFSMNSFKALIPTLATLTTAGDAEVAALAQQTSSYIQSTARVAAN